MRSLIARELESGICGCQADSVSISDRYYGEPELALIVGAARSGTTLTRLVLDAHPEIGCPAEAGVPALMSHMLRLWMTVDAGVGGARQSDATDPGVAAADARVKDAGEADVQSLEKSERDPLERVPDEARRWVRRAVLEAMRRYTRRGGKRIYVDKSLDSVYHLPLVNGLFPGTRSVLLFRHVMDTVASGIEASPWGFSAYGYAPYVQASPGNSVAALANYWLQHVTAALRWEQRHSESCLRVRYEDLVLRPEQTVAAIQAFLGVAEDLSTIDRALRRPPPRGPGDYKVGHTQVVHASSIGHGKRVPVGMLPPGLLAAVSERLEELGYERLTPSWNTVERPVDLGGEGIWATRLIELMDSARVSDTAVDLGPFALVAEDHRTFRWVVDAEAGTIVRGDGEVETVVTGTAEALVLMLTGEENLGVLLRSGRVRHLMAEDEEGADVPSLINQLVTAITHEGHTLGGPGTNQLRSLLPDV